MEAHHESLEDVHDALEAPPSGRHPRRQLVDDVRRLQTEQRLAMTGSERVVEGADVLLVLGDHHR